MKTEIRNRILRLLKITGSGLLLASALMLGSPAHAVITFQFQYTDAPGTGFLDLVYGPGRQAALNTAAAGFSNMFGSHFSNSGTIVLEATSINDNGSGMLASASSYYLSGPGAPGFNIGEVVPIKLQQGIDLNGDGVDGIVTVNFAQPWELDVNRPPVSSWGWSPGGWWYPSGTYDFYSTLYHEFTHVLGFNSTINSSGSSFYGDQSWNRFDSFIVDKNDVPIIDPDSFVLNQVAWGMGSVGNWAGGGSEGLFFGGANTMAANGGSSVTLYTSNEWEQGSSVDHLDDRIPGREEMLMTPFVDIGPAARYYSNLEVAMLMDLGYSITAVPEPETYAMMLAGLAMLGCIIRRRRAWVL